MAAKLPTMKESLSPPKNPSAASAVVDDDVDRKPRPDPRSADPHGDSRPLPHHPFLPSSQDVSLSGSAHLTRPELLRRRLHNLRQLSRCYKHHYWALMEDLRFQYRQYYWKYGASPFKEDEERERREGDDDRVEGSGETRDLNSNGNGGRLGEDNHQCVFLGCKLKAMALSRFCHMHIISDPKQKLYKPCTHVIKSAQAGPLTCGKPILSTTVPSLCTTHFQMAQKHVARALKKSGLNVSSSSKLVPKLHVVVTEYVRQIQARRRLAKRAAVGTGLAVKTETAN